MAANGLVKVFFCDGVHLIYGYTGGYSWCKERMCVPSSYGRKRVNLLGFMDAVTLKTEKVTEEKYLNSDSVCKGLKKLRKNYPDKFICNYSVPQKFHNVESEKNEQKKL